VDRNEESRRTSEFLGDISLRNDTVITCIFTSVPEFEKRQSPLFNQRAPRESLLSLL
jgi:hypothetical protein